jgi:uncharacterized protein
LGTAQGTGAAAWTSPCGDGPYALEGIKEVTRRLVNRDEDEAFAQTEVEVARITVDRARLADFCRRHHIRRLAFFGSVLRDDFRADSDVDVLVEFEPDHVPGLAFFGMEIELSAILGRRVDLNTPQFVSPNFRSQVLEEAEEVITAE